MEAGYVEPVKSGKNVRNLEVVRFEQGDDLEPEILEPEILEPEILPLDSNTQDPEIQDFEHFHSGANENFQENDENLDYLEEVAFGQDMLARQLSMQNSLQYGSYNDFKVKSDEKE